MTARFSVIIPTRNREEFLPQAVESVLAQEGVSLELLLVNDGDPLTLSFADPRVHVLDNRKRTAVPARNLGVAHATGEFIAFLDDDDFWIDLRHLAKAQAQFDQHTDFYFANGEMRFADGSVKLFDRNATASSLEKDNTILISAVCYRRKIHEQLGRFDEALPYYWDWDWYLRVARGGFSLFHQKAPAVAIRVHQANMSGQNEAARRANLDALQAKHSLPPIPLKNHTDFV
ncbi:MAG: glycosyltransferase [Alphaproteobacteria bacterium]|nr:glycosyltransferase [Alphaproteobacteria bacterium]